MRRLLTFTLGTTLTVASVALAYGQASLSEIKGAAMVKRGGGFARVTQPTPLAVGQRVMVNPGNRARVTYADGCTIEVVPGAVTLIDASSPCSAFAQATPQDDDSCFAERRPGEESRGCGPFIAAAVGGGLAIGAIILLSKDDDDGRPISP